MNAMVAGNLHKNYLYYNALTNAIEPIYRHEVSFRRKRLVGGRSRARYIEAHELTPHPFSKKMDETDIHRVSQLVDPLHGVLGQRSKLGSYIQIKKLPNLLNICIKRGVQARALFLLAVQILQLNKTNYTHLLIKRMRNGRYVFKSLYTTKQLQEMTPDALAEGLIKLIKKRKYIHLLAKPNQTMYKSFDERYTL